MPSQRALAGVAHDIAHHAASGLSYIHPHLYQACVAAGVRTARIDLLASDPYPSGLPEIQPLRLALGALQEKFSDVLRANGFAASDVAEAGLAIQFPLAGADGYTCQSASRLVSARGRVYTAALS